MYKTDAIWTKATRHILPAFLGICLLACPAAASTKSVSVTSQGQLGAVDISYVQEGEGQSGPLLPGDEITLKGSVVNHAEPCYIRVMLTYGAEDKSPDEETGADTTVSSVNGIEEYNFDESCITLADSGFKRIGDYYYYPKVVEKGQQIDFIKSISIPKDWGNESKDVVFSTAYRAEAVQASHFTPDFSSEDPWHGTVIQSFDTSNYQVKAAGNDVFKIICDDSAKELIAVGDDFFSNWSRLMPGDTLTGSLTITNKMNVPVKMWFDTKTSGKEALLKNLHMLIKNGDTVIFDASMDKDVDSAKLLQTYKAASSSKLTYTLTIPEDLDNSYALETLKTVWHFKAEIVGQTSSTKTTASTRKTTSTSSPAKVSNVKTGDAPMEIFWAALVVSGLFLMLLLKKRKGAD